MRAQLFLPTVSSPGGGKEATPSGTGTKGGSKKIKEISAPGKKRVVVQPGRGRDALGKGEGGEKRREQKRKKDQSQQTVNKSCEHKENRL